MFLGDCVLYKQFLLALQERTVKQMVSVNLGHVDKIVTKRNKQANKKKKKAKNVFFNWIIFAFYEQYLQTFPSLFELFMMYLFVCVYVCTHMYVHVHVCACVYVCVKQNFHSFAWNVFTSFQYSLSSLSFKTPSTIWLKVLKSWVQWTLMHWGFYMVWLWSSVFVLALLRWLYERTRLPIVPIYGFFPVKLM